MGSKLYVGNLAWGVNNESLLEAFKGFGEVREAKVIMDRETGQSRGFGFVTFANDADAATAISAMDGTSFSGRNLRVNAAENKGGGPNRESRSSDRSYSSDRGYSNDRSYSSDRGYSSTSRSRYR